MSSNREQIKRETLVALSLFRPRTPEELATTIEAPDEVAGTAWVLSLTLIQLITNIPESFPPEESILELVESSGVTLEEIKTADQDDHYFLVNKLAHHLLSLLNELKMEGKVRLTVAEVNNKMIKLFQPDSPFKSRTTNN